MKITKLKYTNDGKRVNIHIDGEYEFTVDQGLVVKYYLFKDKLISKEVQEDLKKEDILIKLKQKAIEKLSKRLYSAKQIRQYLSKQIYKLKQKQGFENTEINLSELIFELKNKHYIDDYVYAQQLVDVKKRSKSMVQIKKILMRKGIPFDLIEKVLEEIDFDEDKIIKKEIEKKIRILKPKGLTKELLEKKVVQSLMRKGFRYSQIKDNFDKLY